MKTDGSNAVQLLLFVGGISLVPALLFTVTGFTRILIVLSFIRTGLGTPTAPPNQVLVGIAFFLTLFVMTPTLKTIKQDAYDPMQSGKITQEVALKTRRGAAARVHVQPDPRQGHRAVRRSSRATSRQTSRPAVTSRRRS